MHRPHSKLLCQQQSKRKELRMCEEKEDCYKSCKVKSAGSRDEFAHIGRLLCEAGCQSRGTAYFSAAG